MKKILVATLLLSFFSNAQASEPLAIDWQDLQGKVDPYKDPFKDLTEEQLQLLSNYAHILEIQKTRLAQVTSAIEKRLKQ